MKYQTRPQPVDADQWTGPFTHPLDGPAIIDGKRQNPLLVKRYDDRYVSKSTVCSLCGEPYGMHGEIHHGPMILVCPNDWVVKDARGHYSSWRPERFEQVYEPAPDASVPSTVPPPGDAR